MNLLKKPQGIEIYFYDEDNLRDTPSLRSSLEEFVEYFQNSSVNIKFVELHSIRLEVLALLLSFTKELIQNGNSCKWICSETFREQLTQMGLENFIELN
jgi:hypothetical protein